MTVAVENGVPLPKRRGGNKAGVRYPFEQMKVEDSFFVPGMRAVSAAVAAAEYCRRNGHRDMKFSARLVESDPVHKTHGVRVWRIR